MTDILILTYTILILAPSIHSSVDDNEIEEPMAYPPGVPRSIYELYNNRIQQDLDARKRNQEHQEHVAVEEEPGHHDEPEEVYPPGVPHTVYRVWEADEVSQNEQDTADTIHQDHHAYGSGVSRSFNEEHHGSEVTEDNAGDHGHHEENHNGNSDNQHVEVNSENGDNTHVQEDEEEDEGVIVDPVHHEVHHEHEQEETYAPGVPHQNYEQHHVNHHEEAASPSLADNHGNVEPVTEEPAIDEDHDQTHHNHTHSILEAGHVMDDEELKHLEKHLLVDTSKMTDIELAFHYFKAHDTDQNQMLDGLELIKFMILSESPGESATPKIFTDNELIDTIENMLKDGDLDNDGYISYSEFRKSYGIE